jgi:hypothetical protein
MADEHEIEYVEETTTRNVHHKGAYLYLMGSMGHPEPQVPSVKPQSPKSKPVKCIGTYPRCIDEIEFVLQDQIVAGQEPRVEIGHCHHCGRLYERTTDNPDEVWLLSTPNKGDAYARRLITSPDAA